MLPDSVVVCEEGFASQRDEEDEGRKQDSALTTFILYVQFFTYTDIW